MTLLLDTHVVLWWLVDDGRLSPELGDRLDHGPDVHLSPVTVWEVGIKQAKGALAGPKDLQEKIQAAGFREVPVLSRHALRATRLPPVHRDPFDRMLVAQALCEGLTLVSADATVARYPVAVLRP